MKEADLKRFSLELITVAEGFYDKKSLPPEVVLIYFDALREYEVEDVIRSLREHVKTPGRCNFFPKPGSLIELIEGTKATAALRAWSKVEGAIRNHGRNRSVVFDDPMIHSVVEEMGGWVKMCETGSEKELDFAKNNFCRRYEACGRGAAYPAVMLGALDWDAVKFGKRMSSPVCIGQAQLAQQVMKLGTPYKAAVPVLLGPMKTHEA